MPLSEKAIKEFQEIYKKEYGVDLPYDEAADAARRLLGFAKLCFDGLVEEGRRKKKLRESPKGFHLEGIGYTCFICGDSVSNEQTWYDKYGIKCLVCQKAIDKKIIPATAAEDKDSWYSKYDLESRFNLDRHALNRFIKQGILKPRTIPDEAGRPHVQIFLIKDNQDILPPKKLIESQLVKETKDGKDWYHSEPWYKFVDPHEHLKGYKIMDHLRIVHGKEEEKREDNKYKDIEQSFQNVLSDLEKDAKEIFKMENVSFGTREMITLRLFTLIDYYSAFWAGSKEKQTTRMIDFLAKYLKYGREESNRAIQIWRHSLVHTGHPKMCAWQWNYENPPKYHWKLEKVDNPPNTYRLYFGFFNLLNDLRQGLKKYVRDLMKSKRLQGNYESYIKMSR